MTLNLKYIHTHICGGESERNLFLGIGSYDCRLGKSDLQGRPAGWKPERVDVADSLQTIWGWIPSFCGRSVFVFRTFNCFGEAHPHYRESICFTLRILIWMLMSSATIFIAISRPVFNQTFGCGNKPSSPCCWWLAQKFYLDGLVGKSELVGGGSSWKEEGPFRSSHFPLVLCRLFVSRRLVEDLLSALPTHSVSELVGLREKVLSGPLECALWVPTLQEVVLGGGSQPRPFKDWEIRGHWLAFAQVSCGVSRLLTSSSSSEGESPADRGGLTEALPLGKVSVPLDALL